MNIWGDKVKREDKKKLCNKIFGRLFLGLLIAFMAIFLSSKTGYYDFELHNRTVLTEEKIKEFEQDVKDGKEINIKNYVISTTPNYQNKVSLLGNKVSTSFENLISSGIESAFSLLGKLLEG